MNTKVWKIDMHRRSATGQTYDLQITDQVLLSYTFDDQGQKLILFDISEGEPRHIAGVAYGLNNRLVVLPNLDVIPALRNLRDIILESTGLPNGKKEEACSLLDRLNPF